MPYSVTKAAQLHLMRCLAATQGPAIRVNAILPGLMLTEWGRLFPQEAISAMEEKAWLKKVVGGLHITPCCRGFYVVIVRVRAKYAANTWLTLLQTDMEDCAQAFVDTAKNSSVTGQRIIVGKST
jgi:NAD(P)-dependent dehydrogenase (short-subunit alcohol dehydrogenase family)